MEEGYEARSSAEHILNLAREADQQAAKVAADWQHKQMPQCIAHPWLTSFPFAIQKLIADEIEQAENMYYNGEDEDFNRVVDDLVCTCLFFLKFQVPCRHLICYHMTVPIFTSETLAQWKYMWEDTGFEMYDRITTSYWQKEFEDEIGAPPRRRLEVKEVCELIKAEYYKAEKLAAEMDGDLGPRYLEWWVGHLNDVMRGMYQQGVVQWHEETEIPRAVRVIQDAWHGQLPSSTPISTACRLPEATCS